MRGKNDKLAIANEITVFGAAVVLIALVLLISKPTMFAQSSRQEEASQPSTTLSEKEINSPEEQSPARVEKGKYYNGMGLSLKDDGQSTRIAITSHGLVNLPPFPFSKSDLVFVGSVKSGVAHLSPDHAGLYSEFTVQVDDILMDRGARVNTAESIQLDEPGGEVKFPSGAVKHVSVQGAPHVSGRYLFFAHKHERGGNYRIITAYDLSSDRVRALDNFPQFQHFKGRVAAEFVSLVRSRAQQFLQTGEMR